MPMVDQTSPTLLPEESVRMISLPQHAPWVALDTETSGLHPDDGARVASVALTWPELPGGFTWDDDPDSFDVVLQTLALPFDQGVRDKLPTYQLDLLEAEVDPNLGENEWDTLLGWLLDQRLVMHNAKFDLTMMRAGTRHWGGVDLARNLEWCTQTAAGEMWPLEARGLDASVRRLGIGTGKQSLEALQDWLKHRGFDKVRYDLAPWYLVEPYVATDTEDTARLYLHQQQELEDSPDEVHHRIAREHDLLVTLYRMEQRGIGYDAGASAEAADLIDSRADVIRAKLPFNPDVKKSVADYFTKTLGLEPDRRTEKKNEPQIDEEQLRAWVKDGAAWAHELDEYNRCKRAVSMWYRGYVEKIGTDGRLRTNFKQGHVKSGRMSVERVQLQAMPKKDKYEDAQGEIRGIFEGVPGVRDLIVPKPGHAIWQLDLSQAELRVASRYAGCRLMLQQLAEGQDIHSNTNREVLHVSEDDPSWKEKRDIAKRLTFGGIFQIGGEKFQRTIAKLADIHLPVEECDDLVRGWRRMYPEFGDMYRKSDQMARRQGWVPLLKGTEYESKSWFGERDYPNSAWNRVVQGSLAKAFAMLLIGVERDWPGHLVLTVHDSVYLECPNDEGAQISSEVAAWSGELMTGLFGIEMSMDVDQPKVFA